MWTYEEECRRLSLHVRRMVVVCPSRQYSRFWLYRFRTTLRNRDNQSARIHTRGLSSVLCFLLHSRGTLRLTIADVSSLSFRTSTAPSLFCFVLHLLANETYILYHSDEDKLITLIKID